MIPLKVIYNNDENGVTRFGKILPLWLNITSLWVIFGMVYLVFYTCFGNFYAPGHIFVVVNGQRLKITLPSGHTGAWRSTKSVLFKSI